MGKCRGFFCLFLLFFTIALWLPMPCAAQTNSPDEALPGGSFADALSWTFDASTGTLSIRGSGSMANFGYDRQPWHAYAQDIQTVLIEDGVTSISTYAFARHSNLHTVSIPESVTQIGKFAFYLCPALSDITLPQGLTTIETALFYSCSSLADIQIPEGVTAIGSDAFELCTSLTSIVIPSKVTTIGNTAFAGCTSLAEVTLPEGLAKLGGGTFYECISLSAITLPAGLSEISDHTFFGCRNLSSICIPGQVSLVDYYAFADCYALTQIAFTGSAPVIDDQAFWGVQAQSHYPGDDPSWTADVQLDYGGYLHWGPMLRPIAANQASTGFPRLTWTGIAEAVSYQVYRASSPNGPYKQVLSTTKETYTNTSAKVGNTYYYKVKALFPNGCTAFSNVCTRTCDLPRPVVTLSNIPETGKIQLRWNAVDGAEQYEIYRASSKNGNYQKIYTTANTSLKNTSIKAGQTYYYQVKALHKKSSANSAFSKTVSRTCDLPRPIVTAQNDLDSGKVRLIWDAVAGAEKYTVYRASSKNGTYRKMFTTSKTCYINTSAVPGTAYYYQVVAIHEKSSAASAPSDIVKRTCDLSRPDVSLSLNSKGKPRLTWQTVDGAEAYEIYRASSKNGTYQKLATTKNTRLTNTSALAGKTYYYKVKAIHPVSAASSSFSPRVSIRSR